MVKRVAAQRGAGSHPKPVAMLGVHAFGRGGCAAMASCGGGGGGSLAAIVVLGGVLFADAWKPKVAAA